MAPTHRMDREAFFQALAGKSEGELRVLLWNLYWRGSAPLRERIEEALNPAEAVRKQQRQEERDGDSVLVEVKDFCALARSGAYMAGNRAVSRSERSAWRFTFKRLLEDGAALLRQQDLEAGTAALEAMLDLACEIKRYDYFHSEDPIQAANILVSEKVDYLWRALLEQDGFPAFTRKAAPQLIRWEQAYGWTRFGSSALADKEKKLADVLVPLLPGVDAWEAFGRAYLDALDTFLKPGRPRNNQLERLDATGCSVRARNLLDWHQRLFERLHGSGSDDLLERIFRHGAVHGPESWFLHARLEQAHGRLDAARALLRQCLAQCPGSKTFQAFAQEIGE